MLGGHQTKKEPPMKNTINEQAFQPSFSLVQDTFGQIREAIGAQMRGAALELLYGMFQEEQERLCGKPFSRKDGKYHRGGSDPGSVILQGQRVAVRKPRVKANGKEVTLDSYAALQDFDLLCDRVIKHMISGVSTRNYEPLLEEISGSAGLKKSSVSKAFKLGSMRSLEEINGRSLSSYSWLAVMIDSIHFASRAVTVAMGITTQGRKVILGLREGATESHEVVKDLLSSLIERGMREEPTLFVLDGAKALRKGVQQVFTDSPIQRCIRHKERNVLEYLPKQYHMEFRRRWKLIHGSSSFALARPEYERLMAWLEKINHGAHTSLQESSMETLTVIRLGASRELRKSLQSTNPLESLFDGVRGKVARVKNWKSGNTQISRWAAASLLPGEKNLRCIRGVKEIPIILANLKSSLQSEVQIA
jgi:putative transposase